MRRYCILLQMQSLIIIGIVPLRHQTLLMILIDTHYYKRCLIWLEIRGLQMRLQIRLGKFFISRCSCYFLGQVSLTIGTVWVDNILSVFIELACDPFHYTFRMKNMTTLGFSYYIVPVEFIKANTTRILQVIVMLQLMKLPLGG